MFKSGVFSRILVALATLSIAIAPTFVGLTQTTPASSATLPAGCAVASSGEVFCSVTFDYSNNTQGASWAVPKGVPKATIELWGGAGGSGGLDCGAGCVAHAGSKVGHLKFTLPVTPGDEVGIYPGGKGSNGASNASGSGGGAGGSSSFSTDFRGGRGGNAGTAGTSGAGGGGGAATIVTYGVSNFIAAGAGGGGGAANANDSGTDGVSVHEPAETSYGANGESVICDPFCDGGSGGGGGGGLVGGAGGGLYSVGNESAGYGGSIGESSADETATALTKNAVTWTTHGRVTITYFVAPTVTMSSTAVLSNAANVDFSLTFSSRLDPETFTTDDLVVAGTSLAAAKWNVSFTSTPTEAPWTHSVRVSPKAGLVPLNGTVELSFDPASVTSLSGTAGTGAVVRRTVTLDRTAPTVKFTQNTNLTTGSTVAYNLVFSETVNPLQESFFGIPAGCQFGAITGSALKWTVTFTCPDSNAVTLTAKGNKITDLAGNFLIETASAASSIDRTPPNAVFELVETSAIGSDHTFDLTFTEPVTGLAETDFSVMSGSAAAGCKPTDLTGGPTSWQITLSGCSNGSYGIVLAAKSAIDKAGNKGPALPLTSGLQTEAIPEPEIQAVTGEVPREVSGVPLDEFFGRLQAEVATIMEQANIIATPQGLPELRVAVDMSNATIEDPLALSASRNVVAGTGVRLTVQVPEDAPDQVDVLAFVQVDGQWQYLGRQAVTGTTVSTPSIDFLKPGNYALKLTFIDHDAVITIGLHREVRSGELFISTAGVVHTAVDPQLTNSLQTVTVNLAVAANPIGAITLVDPNAPTEEPTPTPTPEPTAEPTGLGAALTLTIPEFVPGEPVANPAIGATGDDNAPSVPFDPLGSVAAITAVAHTTTAAVAVAASVAAAAGAAAGAAGAAAGAAGGAGASAGGGGGAARGGGGASSSSSSSSGGASADANSGDDPGSIANLDGETDTYTAESSARGDNLRFFRWKWMRFTDRRSHDLSIALAPISPILSKSVNDGAYLRAILGSFWLGLPFYAIFISLTALFGSKHDGLVPGWQYLMLIAVIGVFDAFSGLIASLVLTVGLVAMHGITSATDVRVLLGVMIICFGPVIIALGFRSIRREGIASFSQFWERVVDFGVLTFFAGWTAATMVSALPALAGRTLVVANHINDVAVAISVAIGVRIIIEEVAAKWFPGRLDYINPTEVPSPGFLQKGIALFMRVAIFVFVTAAIIGASWQVVVGSILFAVPTAISWFSDRFPNSRRLWLILPSGVPGLAFSLLVAAISSNIIGGIIGDTPDRAAMSFALLPIPMVILAFISLFGRHGEEGEEKPLKKPKFRWIYRLGGPIVLLATMHVAGVI